MIFLSKLQQRCVIFTHFFNSRWNKILQKGSATRMMFLPQKKLCVRAFVQLEAISCLLKKFLVTGRKLLSQEEIP